MNQPDTSGIPEADRAGSRPGNSISITGGSFQSSAIGIGQVHQRNTTIGAESSASELRALLADHAVELAALGRTADDRDEIQHEIRAIDRELEQEDPSGPVVRSRWQAVLDALDGVLRAGGKLSEITDLMHKVFGA